MINEPTHLDLFTGLGGFAIAARWAGFRTVAMCEKDERCRRFLARAHPDIPCHDDIRGIDGRRYRGLALLTGGPPCQPSSRAGQQRGAADDRWLWDETLRVLDEARPDGLLLETPPGIEDVGFDRILAQMEGIGYAVRPFDIPACAVNSPQLRRRYWIVGFMADGERRGLREGTGQPANGRSDGDISQIMADSSGLADDAGDRRRETCPRSAHGHYTGRRGRELADTAIEGHQGHERRRLDHAQAGRAEQDRPATACAEDMADTAGPSRAEQQREPRREVGRETAATDTAESEGPDAQHMADAPQQYRLRRVGEAQERGGADTELADAERERRQRGTVPTGDAQGEAFDPAGGLRWEAHVWVPCLDGYLRRAPDESVDVVNGLHRSLLAALGNSIVPEVAYEIINTMKPFLCEKPTN